MQTWLDENLARRFLLRQFPLFALEDPETPLLFEESALTRWVKRGLRMRSPNIPCIASMGCSEMSPLTITSFTFKVKADSCWSEPAMTISLRFDGSLNLITGMSALQTKDSIVGRE